MFTNWPFVSNLSCYLNVFRPCFVHVSPFLVSPASSVPLCVRTISAPRPAARDAKDSAVRQSQNQTCHESGEKCSKSVGNLVTTINSLSSTHQPVIAFEIFELDICYILLLFAGRYSAPFGRNEETETEKCSPDAELGSNWAPHRNILSVPVTCHTKFRGICLYLPSSAPNHVQSWWITHASLCLISTLSLKTKYPFKQDKPRAVSLKDQRLVYQREAPKHQSCQFTVSGNKTGRLDVFISVSKVALDFRKSANLLEVHNKTPCNKRSKTGKDGMGEF